MEIRRKTIVCFIALTCLSITNICLARPSAKYVYTIYVKGCEHEPYDRELTGFRVKGLKGIVTALHGVADISDSGKITAKSDDRGTPPLYEPFQIIQIDKERDLALLSSEKFETLIDNREKGDSQGYAIEEKPIWNDYQQLTIIGHPYGIDTYTATLKLGTPRLELLSSLVTAEVGNLFHDRQSPSLKNEVLKIEDVIVSGYSGAPLFNQNGNVVAVANGGLEHGFAKICWAIPAQHIKWVSPSEGNALKSLRENSPTALFSFGIEDQETGLGTGDKIKKPAIAFLNIENLHTDPIMKGVEERAAVLINNALDETGRFKMMKVPAEIKGDIATLHQKFPDLNYLVSGTLTGDDSSTEIALEFVDVATGNARNLKAFNITTPHIDFIAYKLMLKIKDAFPVTGKVIAVRGAKIYVDLGQIHGVSPEDTLYVTRQIDIGARKIDEYIGDLFIDNVYEDTASGDFTNLVDEDVAIAEGMGVQTSPPFKTPEKKTSGKKDILVICTFKNESGDKSLDYMTNVIAENLATELTGIDIYTIREKSQLDTIYEELKLTSSDLFDLENAVERGGLYTPGYLVVGSFQKEKGNILINARVDDMETGAVQYPAKASGPETDLSQLSEELGRALKRSLSRSNR